MKKDSETGELVHTTLGESVIQKFIDEIQKEEEVENKRAEASSGDI